MILLHFIRGIVRGLHCCDIMQSLCKKGFRGKKKTHMVEFPCCIKDNGFIIISPKKRDQKLQVEHIFHERT